MAIPLFQFWNTTEPPAQVAQLMASWEADPAFSYRRYTTETADAYIAKHLDARTLEAYRQCAIPAMQADFFRYCALFVEGGVYVDADTECGGDLAAFIEHCTRGMLMNRETRIANDFLFVCAANDPLFERCIEDAVQNIEKRVSNDVWQVTGPWIMTKLYNAERTKPMFDGFTIRPVTAVRNVVQFRHKLDYKSGPDDWRQHREAQAASIFRDG